MPTSASPVTPESTSASPKELSFGVYVFAYVMFWLTIAVVSSYLADALYGVKYFATLSSASYYIIAAFVFLYTNTAFKLPPWIPLVIAILAAIQLMLKYHHPLFDVTLYSIWLIIYHNAAEGKMMPWHLGRRLVDRMKPKAP